MSQPCSAVELVLFDARELTLPKVREDVETVVSLGVLAGAVLNGDNVAQVVDAAGQSDRLGFWFGDTGRWPFDRVVAFANVEPGRILLVTSDPDAREQAVQAGVRLYDEQSGEIATLLP